MHLLIPHACPPGPQCQAAIGQLVLPKLTELMGLLSALPATVGSPDSLTPLAERLRAQAMGLSGADGLIPWAALDAQQLGLTKIHGADGWAWITPCHLSMQSEQVLMDDPNDLQISVEESETLRAAMKRYFEDDGITLHTLTTGTWLAHGNLFKNLPTASLDRVAGAAINRWIPMQPEAKLLRRLQNEMQMLLYTHGVNTVRDKRKLPAINAFWVSGTGTPPTTPAVADTSMEWVDALRHTALRDDATGWLQAWHTLDESVLAPAALRAKTGKAPLRITLCGQRQAVTLELQDKPWWSRVKQHFAGSAPQQLLQSL